MAAIGREPEGADKTRAGLEILRGVAAAEQGSSHSLTRVAKAFLEARPEKLRDANFALACIDKALGHDGGDAAAALLKARALRQLGREAQAVAMAAAALAQLPPPPSGASPATSVRRKIETFLSSR
jgi:hypothetical protein